MQKWIVAAVLITLLVLILISILIIDPDTLERRGGDTKKGRKAPVTKGIRKTEPEQGNKYYIRKVNGGWNPCIEGSPVDGNLTALANCVGYVIGRYSDWGQTGNCDNGLKPYDAKDMYPCAKADGLAVGGTPKVGAVICFKDGYGGYGHVGIVEQIKNSSTLLVSESAYGGPAFRLREYKKVKGKWTWDGGSSYTWQGFIYNRYLTNADVLMVRKLIAAHKDDKAFDFNGDGKLNMKDVLVLRRSIYPTR